MARVNITTGKFKLILRAEFGANFIEETARAAGVNESRVVDWVRGKRRPPASLFSEIQKRDPAKALARIDRYQQAAADTLARDCQERKRRVGLARDFIAEALAKAPDAPQALRQRKGGEAPEAPQKRTK